MKIYKATETSANYLISKNYDDILIDDEWHKEGKMTFEGKELIAKGFSILEVTKLDTLSHNQKVELVKIIKEL